MKPTPTRSALGALMLALSLAACGDKQDSSTAAPTAAEKAIAEARILEDEAAAIALQGVLYGLPLVLVDVTMKKATNVAAPAGMAAPVNRLVNVRAFPDASFKDVVRANVDTLYSSAFMDLSKEPMVLSVPDTKGRYYLMPMLDAWTNVFASPGKRTSGTKAGHFAIVGPGWTGTLPEGVTELKSPTSLVWMIGRTQTDGPKDYAAVHRVQDGFKLVPLSAFGKPYQAPAGAVDPSVDMKTAPIETVTKMTAADFFNRLARLMKDNPPAAADAPMLEQLAKIGVVPGQPFDAAKLGPAVARAIEPSVQTAIASMQQAAKMMGKRENGWRVPAANLGSYGTDYATRAVVALVGLGANLPADAIYPSAFADADDKPLDGANRYVLHFAKGQTPPDQAFWSVTMYNAQSFFVDNPAKRYALSSWMPLKRNHDGSLDLYIQKDSPGKGMEANWLPAPSGEFNLTMRVYWPKPEALDGTWKPPGLTIAR